MPAATVLPRREKSGRKYLPNLRQFAKKIWTELTPNIPKAPWERCLDRDPARLFAV
jgi:hypothetical protein